MKPITIAASSIVGTLGVVAAIGFAQPDGLQPPAGPVADTSPSLADLLDAIEQVASADGNDVLEFQAVPNIGPNNSFVLNVPRIQLVRVHALQGAFTATDSLGRNIQFFAATSETGPRSDPVQFDFDIVLDGPVTFQSGNEVNQQATVFYKELP
jgi:hypothetical protein